MPIIGNPIYQSAFVVDQFSGNGSTVAFTMSVAPAGVTNVLVAVSGVIQDPSTYGVVGNTITFSAAPPSGTGNISCRYLGVPATGVTTTAYRTVTEFTATAGQTTFAPPSYNVGFINVYLNGVLLGSADYTANNGATVVLATGASAGNLVTVESFQISSVANAIANAAGSVSSSNLATNSVTTTKIADANVTTAKLASTTGSGAVVLATSPTLVTPALGTPSAINLSNATALPSSALPSGSVLQVQNVVMRDIFGNASGGSYVLVSDGVNPLQITITLKNSGSTLLLISNINSHAHNRQGGGFVVVRGSSYSLANVVDIPTNYGSRTPTNIGGAWTGDGSGDNSMLMNISTILSDAPGAGTFTYGIYCTTISGTQGGTRVNASATDGDVDSLDYVRAVSTFTIMEIAP
jgi:hypothetical protein